MADRPRSSLSESQLTKQPNSRHCFVCGMSNPYGLALSFYEDREGQVVAELEVPDHYEGFPGVVHGGILASLLDEAASRAAMVEDHNRFFVTAKMTIRYRRPVPVGEPLRLVGGLIKGRGRITTATAKVVLQDGSVGAEAEATMVDHPEGNLDSGQLDALGWKVYPD